VVSFDSDIKKINRFAIFAIFLLASLLLTACALSFEAQAQDDEDEDEDDEPSWMGPLAGIGMIGIFVLIVVINILILVWIYKDAEKRGKSGIGWMVFALICGPLACIIWLIVRGPA